MIVISWYCVVMNLEVHLYFPLITEVKWWVTPVGNICDDCVWYKLSNRFQVSANLSLDIVDSRVFAFVRQYIYLCFVRTQPLLLFSFVCFFFFFFSYMFLMASVKVNDPNFANFVREFLHDEETVFSDINSSRAEDGSDVNDEIEGGRNSIIFRNDRR